MPRLLLCAAGALAVACSTQVPATNPYDPGTPDPSKAKATVRGTLSAATLASVVGLEVDLKQNNKTAQTATTGAGGAFVLAGVTPGPYLLECDVDGFLPLLVPISAGAGDDLDLGALTLQEQAGADASAITGVVTLSGPADHSGTLVEAVGRAYTTVTDTSGAFRLSVVQGTYQLRFSHTSFLASTIDNLVVGRGATIVLPPLALAPNPATIKGHVDAELAAGGSAALQNAIVTVEGTSLTALTNAQGDFTLTGVPAGSFLVKAVSGVYAPQSLPVLNLEGGEVRTMAQPFLLSFQRGSLAGKVLLSDGAPPAGTVVELAPSGRTQLTAADGSFVFDNLVAGPVYQLSARHDGYQEKILGAAFAVGAGTVSDAGTFTLATNPATLRGHADVEGPTGLPTPAVGATVSLDGTSVSGVISSSGDFALGNVPSGSYVVRVTLAPYATQTATVLNLAAGEDRTLPAPFLLPIQRGNLVGSVTLSDRADGSGTAVRLSPGGLTALTGADGSFAFDGLAIGTYSLDASHAGYQPQTLGSAFIVVAGATQAAGSFALSPDPATITGHVDGESILGDKQPLSGATVSIDGTSLTTQTTAGDFILTGVPVGSYVIRARMNGFHDGTQAVLNLAGGETRALPESFSLSLARGGVSGTVALSDSPSDASGVTVEVIGSGQAQVTGVTGSYSFGTLIPGSYSISLTKDKYGQRVLGPYQVTADHAFAVPPATLQRQGGAVTVVEAPFTTLLGVHLQLSASNETGYHASEDATFQDPAKGDLATDPFHPFSSGDTVPFTLSDADGEHIVYVVFSNGTVASDVVQASVVVDRKPPDAPAVTVGHGGAFIAAQNGIVTLAIGGADFPAVDGAKVSGVASMEISNFSSFSPSSTLAFNFTTTWTLDNPSIDGLKTVYVRLIDRAANVGDFTAVPVTLDNHKPTSPSIVLTGPDPLRPGYTRTPLVTATLSAADANGGPGNQNLLMKLSNNSGFAGAVYQPFQSPATWFLAPQDGDQTVYVRFMDPAGNESDPASAPMHLDSAAPFGSISLKANNIVNPPVTNATQVTLTYTVAPDTTGYKLSTAPLDCSSVATTAFSALPPANTETKSIGPAAGTYAFYACFCDAAGNTAQAQASVVLDTTPPSALLQAGNGSGYSTTASVPLTLIGPSGDLAGVSIAPDAAPSCAAASYSTTLTNLSVNFTGDGPHDAYVCLRDAAGNTAGPLGAHVVVDGAKPTGTAAVVGAGPGNKVRSRTVVLDLSGASDPAPASGLATMQLFVDGVAAGPAAPFAASAQLQLPAGDGSHSLTVALADKAGNSNTLPAVPVVLDTLPPAASVSLNAGAATNLTSVTLTYVPDDSVGYAVATAPMDCASLPATAFSALPAGNSEAKGIGPAEGGYTFYVCFRDGAGNVTAASAGTVYDQTPPSATLQAGNGSGYANAVPIPLTLVGASSDLAFVKTGVDSAPDCSTGVSGSPASISVNPAADGSHTVYLCLKDKAGNFTAAPLSASVFLDRAAPGGSAAIPGLGASKKVGSRNIALDLSGVTDAAPSSGVAFMQVLIDSTSFGPDFAPFAALSFLQLPAGEGASHSINVQVKDRAGNVATLTPLSGIILDTTPPPGSVSLNVGPVTKLTSVTLTYTPGDATGYKVATAPMDCKGLAPGDFASPVPASEIKSIGPTEGLYAFYVCFVDGAGNVGSATASTTLDTTAPSALLQAGTGSGYSTARDVPLSLVGASSDLTKIAVGLDAAPNCSVAGGYVTNSVSNLHAPFTSDGAHTVYLCAMDPAGNFTATALSAPIVVDTVAPAGSGAIPGLGPANKTKNAQIDLDLSGVTDAAPSSGLALMQVLFDSTAFGANGDVPFAQLSRWQIPSAGVHSVNVRVKDKAGLSFQLASIPVELDQTPPPVTLQLVAGSVTNPPLTKATTHTLNYLVTSDTVGYKVATAPLDCASLLPTDFVALPPGNTENKLVTAEGPVTYYACFRDGAMNVTALSISTIVDLTPPTATLKLGDGSGFWNSQNVPVTLIGASSDLAAAPLQVVAGGSAPDCSTGAYGTNSVAAFASDGGKTVWVCLIDKAGNFTPAPLSAQVSIDTVLPAGSAAIPGIGPGNKVGSRNIDLDLTGVTDATPSSGLTGMQVLFDSTSFGGVYSAFATLSRLQVPAGEGLSHTVNVKVRDAAGNAFTLSPLTVVLDTTPPTGTVSLSAAGVTNPAVTNQTSVTLNYSPAADAIAYKVSTSQIDCSGLAAADFTSGIPASETKALPSVEGPYTFYVCYRDGAGNVAATSVGTTLDLTKPVATLTIGNGTSRQSTLTPVPVITAPADVKGYLMQLDGTALSVCPASVASYTTPFNASPPLNLGTEGLHTVYVCLLDNAGNVSASVASAQVTADVTRPASGSVVIQGVFADGTSYTSTNSLTASTGVTVTLNPSDANGGTIAQMKVSNLDGLPDADWQPFHAQIPWILLPGDGPKSVYAMFMDSAGNTSLSQVSGGITLASAGPFNGSLTINAGASVTNVRTATLALAASNATQYALAVDGTAITPTGCSPPAGTNWCNLGGGGTATVSGIDLLNGGAVAQERAVVVTVKYRSAVRVEGGGASASIYYDKIAPGAGGTLSLTGTLGNNQASSTMTATPVVFATVRPPANSNTMQIAIQQASDLACTGAFGGTVNWQPFTPVSTFLLSGTVGDQFVCVAFQDEAGNFDLTVHPAAKITIDLVPPTNPSFVNLASGYTQFPGAPADASGNPIAPTVTTVTDTGGVGGVVYQCLGGQYLNWTDCGAASINPTTDLSSPFTLQQNAENNLAVRARDAAYNYSAGTVLRLVHDNTAPIAPLIVGISSSAQSVTLSWLRSPSDDVVRYQVNYGTSPGDVTGTGAAQGPSPVDVGDVTSFQLTGLVESIPYYLSVVALDAAGNASFASGERLAVPNKVNPRLLSSFGGDPRAVGWREVLTGTGNSQIYMAQNQGIVSLDVLDSGNGVPTFKGRVVIPNLVPSSTTMPVRSCTIGGVNGDCVFVTGTTSEGDFRNAPLSFRAGIYAAFFPIAGVNQGKLIGGIPFHAQHIALTSSGTTLFGVGLANLNAYDVTDPSAIGKISGLALPFTFNKIYAAGLVGSVLYILGNPSSTTEVRLLGVNVTNPAAMTLTDYGDPQQQGGAAFSSTAPPTPAFAAGGVFLGYPQTVSGNTSFRVSAYTPATGAWPRPANEADNLSLHTFTGATRTIESFSAVAGTHMYFFCRDCCANNIGFCAATEPQAYEAIVNSATSVSHGQDGAFFANYTYNAPSAPLAHATGAYYSSKYHAVAVDYHDPQLGPAPLYQVDASLRRWRTDPTLLTPVPGTYNDGRGQIFTEMNGFVISATGTTLKVTDVTNPLLPWVTQLYDASTTGPMRGGAYSHLSAHGLYLFAGVDGGNVGFVDVYQMGPSRTLVYKSSIPKAGDPAIWGVKSMVSEGGYLFVGTQQNSVHVYNLQSPTSIGELPGSPVGTIAAYGLDVRANYLYYTNFGGTFETSLFNPATNPPLVVQATVTPPFNFTTATTNHVTCRGLRCAVSDISQTFVALVSNPAAPSFSTLNYAAAGPSLFTGGYLVGLDPWLDSTRSPTNVPEGGPDFIEHSADTIDGRIPYLQCGPDNNNDNSGHGASLEARDGVFYASCNRNGTAVISPVSTTGGRLLKRNDDSWLGTSAPIASDGMYTFLGGQYRTNTGNQTLLQESEETMPSDITATNPVLNGTAPPSTPLWMWWDRGVNYTVLSPALSAQPQLVSYDVSRPTSAWTALSTLSFGAVNAGSPMPPVSDGETMYLVTSPAGATQAQLISADIRKPNSLALLSGTGCPTTAAAGVRFGGMALHRERLYVAHNPSPPVSNGASIDVYPVLPSGCPQTGEFAVASPIQPVPAAAPCDPSAVATEIQDIAVAQQVLIYTFSGANYSAPYGLGLVRLANTNRDGNPADGLLKQGCFFSSPLPLGSPTFVGDTLYVRHNHGIATFDLTPTWANLNSPGLPTYIGSQGIAEAILPSPTARMLIQGPWAFVLGTGFRVYDLR